LKNKPSLKHEVEESIVALRHLHEWMSSRGKERSTELTVVDMCYCKGFFSMLLSYMVGTFWQDCEISSIVLLDKATGINWEYIDVANDTATEEGRPILTLWKGVNLHNYDVVLDRLLELQPTKLALVGIHLCKNLSPAAVSLVHGLGRELCPYLMLAPCCLPRTVTSKYIAPSELKIRVYQYESRLERSKRMTTTEKRERALGRGRKGFCYICSIFGHRVKDCPTLEGQRPKNGKMFCMRLLYCFLVGLVEKWVT
jgi:hypothetical protein